VGTLSLRPDATLNTDAWSNVGGAPSFHAAVADESDATYIQGYGSGLLLLGMADAGGIPALAQIRSVTTRVRVGAAANPTTTFLYSSQDDAEIGWSNVDSFRPTTTIQTLTGAAHATAPGGAAWTAAALNRLRSHTITGGFDGPNTFRLYALWWDVLYNEAPTATVTGPADEDAGTAGVTVLNTSTPTVSWAYADPEGDAQERYRVRVFASEQYEAAGFDPETAAATWDSGVVVSSASSVVVGTALAGGLTYRAYVKVADAGSGGRFGPWSFRQFSMNLSPPPAPTLSGAFEAGPVRVLLEAASTGAPAPEFLRFEFSDDGGTTWSAVRGGARVATVSGATRTVFDHEAPPGSVRRYRAKAGRVVSGSDVLSGASAVVGPVAVWVSEWWLKDVSAPSLNTTVEVQPPLDTKDTESLGVFRPLGRNRAVVVADALTGEEGTLRVEFFDQAAYDAFLALRARQRPLLLQGPTGENLYVRLLAERSTSYVVSAGSVRFRRVAVPFVTVDAPA
jgi:hypothetical protein